MARWVLINITSSVHLMSIIRSKLKVIIFFNLVGVLQPTTHKIQQSVFSVSTHMPKWTADVSGIPSADNSRIKAQITLQGVPSRACPRVLDPAVSFLQVSLHYQSKKFRILYLWSKLVKRICKMSVNNSIVKFFSACMLMLGYIDSLNACVCPCEVFHSVLTHLYSNKP
jgi:hypothetical protein